MKILIWVREDDVETLNKGEIVEYFNREPGVYERAVQVSVDSDTYQKLKDENNDEKYSGE
tara:strand:- start:112 stop:291 length:180 start_codon:yes stop_codon:yes gene_type:complete